jgi:hypothetical protein
MDKCCAGGDALEDLCEGCNEDFTEISYSIMEHKTTGIQINAEYGEVDWVGLEVSELLKKDMKLSECKQKLSDMFASIGIDISPDKLYFDCDVCSNG